MDDLIETVARAICNASGGCKYFGPKCNTGRCNTSPEEAQAAIRAVLDGIREPDEAMIEAGLAAGCATDQVLTDGEWMAKQYAAMIDELRKRYD